MRRFSWGHGVIGALLAISWAGPAGAVTTVCVDVQVKEWTRVTRTKAEGEPRSVAVDAAETEAAERQDAAKPPNTGSPDSRATDTASPETPPEGDATGDWGTEAAPEDAASPDASSPPAAPRIPFVPASAAPAAADVPKEKEPLDPALYLKRMLEYEVTHEPSYAAVVDECQQRLTVELYALDDGWTIFARYTGNQREEKVDRVQLDEFVPLAERVARALLHDRPITETMTRENVLRSDSTSHLRSVSGRGHFVLAMGTTLRLGKLPTAGALDAPAAPETRLFTPLNLQLGSRYKLRAWGLDAFVRLNLGTQSVAMRENPEGGHVDYSWGTQAGLRFLRYADPAGISSFYYGGGADFELAIFRGITRNEGWGSQRKALTGGGLNLTGLVGWEFLRSSATHFFVQAELQLPTYVFDVANSAAKVNTWLPGAVAQVGMAL